MEYLSLAMPQLVNKINEKANAIQRPIAEKQQKKYISIYIYISIYLKSYTLACQSSETHVGQELACFQGHTLAFQTQK